MVDIYFAQIREDSRVERRLVRQTGAERIVCIGSGGCTAFSLLDDAVSQVIVVDANPAQCALIELKAAAILELDRDDFLAFIGERPTTRRNAIYADIRPALSGPARRYWDSHGDRILAGINRSGVTERYYDFVGRNIRASVIAQDVIEELLSCDDIEVQHNLYRRHFETGAWRDAMRILLSKQSNLSFYPAFWYAHAQERDFENLLMPLLTAELTEKPAVGNYFIAQILLGHYLDPDAGGAPHYLSAEGYESARRNMAKLDLQKKPIQHVLAQEQGIDAFFLSNIFDWGKAAHARAVWEGILGACSDGATFLIRHMYQRSTVPSQTFPSLHVDADLSEACRRQERSMLYRHIQVGTITSEG